MALAQTTTYQELMNANDKAMKILLTKLDEAIDDMENGRVQTIDTAWEEIEAI